MTPGSTATHNTTLALRRGGFANLSEALDYAALGETGINFFSGIGLLVCAMTYEQLKRQAQACAAVLIHTNLARGSRIALIAETSPAFLTLFYACQYAGYVPCTIPMSIYPGAKDAWQRQLHSILSAAVPSVVLGPESVGTIISEASDRVGTYFQTFEEVLAAATSQAADRSADVQPLTASEAAYVQFSSGSTAEPKGILIHQDALRENVKSILEDGMNVGPDDRALSWLPMYHDMGLVGFSIAALSAQRSVDYLSPLAFSKRPSIWLELLARQKATISYAPAFAYDLVRKRTHTSNIRFDLSNWRVAGIGGEMIPPRLLTEFALQFCASGFQVNAFKPSYGLAEATLALTMCGPGVVTSTRTSLAASERQFVSCGQPLAGVEVRIVDVDEQVLPEREVGRIQFKSDGIMAGYLVQGQLRAIDRQIFFDSGDLGFLDDGELFVTGRADDVIVVRGRNLWPQDIEWCVEGTASLHVGDVAVIADAKVSNQGGADVVVVMQCRAHVESHDGLRSRIATEIGRAFGVRAHIVLVPPGSLPYTTSGKLQRGEVRRRFARGDYTTSEETLFHDRS